MCDGWIDERTKGELDVVGVTNSENIRDGYVPNWYEVTGMESAKNNNCILGREGLRLDAGGRSIARGTGSDE